MEFNPTKKDIFFRICINYLILKLDFEFLSLEIGILALEIG